MVEFNKDGACPICGQKFLSQACHHSIRDARATFNDKLVKLETINAALVDALESVMLRWADYIAIAQRAGEPLAYTEQAKEYGKQAHAALKLAKAG